MTSRFGGVIGAQAIEGGRRIAGLLRQMAPLPVANAQRHEQMLVRGHQVGLTPAETREVIAAWTTATGRATDWRAVEDAMVRRALREEWRPPR